MKKDKIYGAVLTVLIILTICFIFGNSLESREVSKEKSGEVMEMLEPLFELIVGEGKVTNHLVRKTAHFVEFFILGALLTARFILAFFSRDMKRNSRRIIPMRALICGVSVAAVVFVWGGWMLIQNSVFYEHK